MFEEPGSGTRGEHGDLLAEVERCAPGRWIYQNLTPWRIHASYVAGAKLRPRDEPDTPADISRRAPHRSRPGWDPHVVKVLSIPALGEITVPRDDARHMSTLNMRRLGQIEVRPAPSEFWTHLPRAVMIFGWSAVGLFFGAWALFFGGASSVPWAFAVAAVVAVPVAGVVLATAREVHLYRRFNRYAGLQSARTEAALAERDRDGAAGSASGPAPLDWTYSLEGVERGSRIRGFVAGVPRHAAEIVVLIGAVLVSVVGLGVAIHLTTQLNDLLPIDYGKFFVLGNPFAEVSELARNSPAFWQLLIGHVAQWVLVALAALVPAAMYFQFDRQRLSSVRRRWVQEVFRLDPTVRTVRDIEAKYGSQIESSFGDPGPDSTLRLGGGRRSPVIVATILLVVGWFLVISTTRVPMLETVSPTNGTNATTMPELVWPGGEFPVASFFRPDLSLVGYAFLGAYVFTLFHVMRGYQRRDLHPKTYNTVVVRVLASYALALVMSVVYDGPTSEVVMFFVGFTPESALVWLRERLARGNKVGPLRELAPLTDLEGIDLYDRTRLAEEGINNVEALAHADIVNLMSSTRISAAQLVDWTDQAILYLHLGGDAQARRKEWQDPGSAAAGEAPSESALQAAPDVRGSLARLRFYGIRTASDLVQAYVQALRRGRSRDRVGIAGDDPPPGQPDGHTEAVGPFQAAELRGLCEALEPPAAPGRGRVWTVQTIIDTLADEEWFVQIRNWRASEFGAADAWYLYLDGHDWTLTRAATPPHVDAMTRRPATVSVAAEARDTIDLRDRPAPAGTGGAGRSPAGTGGAGDVHAS